MSAFTPTTVRCHPKARHYLQVKVSSVRHYWQGLPTKKDQELRPGVIEACCLTKSCPGHNVHHFVGAAQIPGFNEIIDA